MKTSRRLPLLLAILCGLAGLVFFDKQGSIHAAPEVVQARPMRTAPEPTAPAGDTAAKADASPSSVSSEPSSLLALHDRRSDTSTPVAGFETHDWTPPPPPPPPPAPPPPPQAPPLPFAFLGKQLEEGKWIVFLSNQERTYVAKEGAVLETAYRVEKIVPPTLSFTYLPLQQQQTLAIGSAE